MSEFIQRRVISVGFLGNWSDVRVSLGRLGSTLFKPLLIRKSRSFRRGLAVSREELVNITGTEKRIRLKQKVYNLPGNVMQPAAIK